MLKIITIQISLEFASFILHGTRSRKKYFSCLLSWEHEQASASAPKVCIHTAHEWMLCDYSCRGSWETNEQFPVYSFTYTNLQLLSSRLCHNFNYFSQKIEITLIRNISAINLKDSGVVMCLLHKHENPSFIPSLLWRLRLVVFTCNPSSGYIWISQLNGSFSSGHSFSTDRHSCPLSYKHSGELKALYFLPYGKFIYSQLIYRLFIHYFDCLHSSGNTS